MITHTLKGWKLFEIVESKDEKGNTIKVERRLSCLNFDTFDGAINYATALGLSTEVKCETCSSSRDVMPEEFGFGFILSCKRCRAVPCTYSPPSDAEAGKKNKKPRVIHELSRDKWLGFCNQERKRFGLQSTGVASLDKALRLAIAPLTEYMAPPLEGSPPDQCQCCDVTLDVEFVDGVVKGAGWAYLCRSCHKKDGIGFGEGRGHLYSNGTGTWRKVDTSDGDRTSSTCE